MDALENVELPLLYKGSDTPNEDELGLRALNQRWGSQVENTTSLLNFQEGNSSV